MESSLAILAGSAVVERDWVQQAAKRVQASAPAPDTRLNLKALPFLESERNSLTFRIADRKHAIDKYKTVVRQREEQVAQLTKDLATLTEVAPELYSFVDTRDRIANVRQKLAYVETDLKAEKRRLESQERVLAGAEKQLKEFDAANLATMKRMRQLAKI